MPNPWWRHTNNMIKNIKKTNLVLSLLFIAFFIVTLSLSQEIQNTSFNKPEKPTIIDIEDHGGTSISHGAEQWALACNECHFESVFGECTDCHIPDFWLGDDDATYFAHHDLSYTGFMDCWSSDCHDPDPFDVRYVKTDLVEDGDWHTFCDKCHSDSDHIWPD